MMRVLAALLIFYTALFLAPFVQDRSVVLALVLFCSGTALALYIVVWTFGGAIITRRLPEAARRLRSMHAVARDRRIHRKAAAVAGMLVVALHVRVCLVERVQVRGPSMVPTLAAGRTLWIEKLSTGLVVPRLDFPLRKSFQNAFPTGRLPRFTFGRVARGDIVVFRYPGLDRSDRRFIKRVIGLPGDRYEIRSGRVYINGAPLAEPYLPEGMVTDPLPRLPQPPVRESPDELALLSPAVAYSAMNGCDQKGVVPPRTLYLLGDNRPHSRDSRTIGFVPIFYIEGIAL